MQLAIFSDVHANLPALEAVLADVDARQPDTVYCLGDLVGYATWPNEVIACIRARRIPTIAGNYDVGVGANSPDRGCAYKEASDQRRGSRGPGSRSRPRPSLPARAGCPAWRWWRQRRTRPASTGMD